MIFEKWRRLRTALDDGELSFLQKVEHPNFNVYWELYKLDSFLFKVPDIVFEQQKEVSVSWHKKLLDFLFPPDKKMKVVSQDFTKSKNKEPTPKLNFYLEVATHYGAAPGKNIWMSRWLSKYEGGEYFGPLSFEELLELLDSYNDPVKEQLIFHLDLFA